jgi:hypothetical protein
MQALPPTAPPPVVINKENAGRAFPGYPRMGEGKSKLVFLGIAFHGDKPLLEATQAKLAREGWQSEFVTLRSGELVVSAGAKARSIDELRVLYRRCVDNDFGAVKCEPLAVPDPSNFY